MTVRALSTLTVDDMRQYGRIDDDESPELLEQILFAAESFCLSYTGLSAAEADEFPDVAVVALVVACDMYDNRSVTVDKDTVSPTVSAILGMHRRNFM